MTAPLPDARLAEIEAAEAAASKGPWLSGIDGYSVDGPRVDGLVELSVAIDVGDPADAVFIAVARDAVPELVREVKRLRAEVLAARAAGYRSASDHAAEMVATHGADADAQMLLVFLRSGAELREQFAGNGGAL